MIQNSGYFLILVLVLSLIDMVQPWCYKTQFADSDRINSIDHSPDGSKIVTASSSGRVIIWNAYTLQQIHVYNAGAVAYSAVFSKDNVLIAIGLAQNNIHIIKASDYSVVTTTLNSGQNQVYGLDFNEANNRMISCGKSNFGKLYQYSGTSVTLQDTTNDKGNWLLCCKFLKPSRMVAFGDKSDDAELQSYWGMAVNWGSTTSTTRGTGGERRSVDWNHVTEQAYYGGTDQNLDIYSKSGNLDKRISLPKEIYAVSVTSDSTYAAAGGQDGLLYIFNVVTKGSETSEVNFTESAPNHITASDFSPDGEYLIVGNDQGMMFVYKRMCGGCPSGTYVNGTQCRACNVDLPGCYLCKNSTHCLGCSNGYWLDTSSTTTNPCKPCFTSMTGCSQCSSNSVCISCVQGYFLNSGTQKCLPCWDSMKGCLMCNSSVYCYQCDFRYYLNATSNKCVSCSNISKCLSCNTSSFCLQCVQGYYEDGAGGCTQCPKNCSNCINGTYCTQCDNSFYLNAGTCALCAVKGCLSCNSSNYCFDCIESMWENAGGCSFCTAPCLECSTSATTCMACIVGYYLNGNTCNSCTGITQGCVGCKGSAATDCTACATGYFLNSGNTCSQCSSLLTNCAQCNSTTCSICKLGFYYDATNTLCKPCAAGCLTCSDATTCLSCQVGYYHTSPANTCTQCPVECAACVSATECYSCNPKYYYNSTNKNCTKCSISKCLLCKDQSTCLTCAQGFFIDNSGALCRSCSNNITNCLDCYNASYCKGCDLGYYLTTNNASCAACTSPCATCNSIDCFTCELGYYLTTTSPKTCQSCPKECQQCTTSTNCSKCVPGYYHDSTNFVCKTCELVKPGCQNCNDTVCFSCKHELGYYRQASDNSCLLCSAAITNCLICQSNTNCLLCKYNYLPTATNSTCTLCSTLIPNCQHCLNSNDCQTCLKGYYLDSNGDCQLCSKGCSTCNDSTHCEICLREYVLETNSLCKLCEDHIAGCEMCRYNPTIQCTNCITGYYIVGTSCTLCSVTMPGCSICSDSTTCQTCSSGYYLNANKCFICSSARPNCQLCHYNTMTSSVDCLDCNDGLFLNAGTLQCETCTDTACLSCSDATTCTRCQTGFYLSSGDCLKCSDLFQACRLCNATACGQCGSGFYLNSSSRCQACSLSGCEICSQLNPTTQCLACNSQYYLTASQTCQACHVALPNCLQCSDSNSCQQCESGYFINPTSKCSLCSSKFTGCSLCTPSVCIECESGYLLDSVTSTCKMCNQYMPGCSFCLSQSNCLSCESGYYANSTSCVRCSTITGCLECRGATQCLFCDYGYYLKNGTCLPCKDAIQNCIACASQTVCMACLGNFILSGGSCNELKAQSYPNYTQIKLITEYVSENQLKHTLQSIGKKINQIQLNWTLESKLYLMDENYQEHLMTIKRTEFSPNGYSLVYYTDNPLSNLTNLNMNNMPILSRRLLQSSFSMNNNFKTKIQMTEEGINSLFPQVHHSGSFFMKYKLSEPQFYRSVVNTKTYYYQYFGFVISVVLIVLYLVKALWIAPEADDQGEIIPHILCYKMMAFVIYPLFGQYLNYCKGFVLLDFPWFNDLLSSMLTVDTDYTPETYKISYNNLNLPSTFLFALGFIFIIFLSTYLILNCALKNATKWNSLKSYLYNLFISGVVISTFLSLQGAYYNPVQTISLNSLFYILGISIFVTVTLESFYSIYKSVNSSVIPFHKVRIILKCIALSLAYVNPLYIFMSLIFLDICLLIIEYILKREKKVTPKLWFFNNVLIDVGLSLMMLGPYSLISVFVASGCIIACIAIDIYIMIKENQDFREIQKVRLHEMDLIKTMQNFEKQQLSAREKNNQIYFKNKVLEDLQIQNTTFYDKKNSTLSQLPGMNHSQQLFFEESESQGRPQYNQIPAEYSNEAIPEAADEHVESEDMQMPEIASPKKRGVKTALRSRKKHEEKQWELQNENNGTFVLADFE